MTRLVPALLVGLFSVTLVGSAAADNEVCVAFWNVENLFDCEDDPAVEGDEEFLPTAEKRWDAQRYDKKLSDLARTIATMHGGRGPDVLGVSEVENRRVLEDLAAKLRGIGREYKVVHQDSPSGRGIDCALLYDSRRVELEKARFHRVDSIRTREIVEAELEIDDHELYVFVNHWPSRGGDREGVGRAAAARVLRTRVEDLMDDDDEVDFLIIGDLNDHPTDPSVQSVLNTWGNPQDLKEGVLFNSTWAIHADKNQGTYYYRDNWEVIDHIICSPGLLDDEGFTWKPGSTRVIKNDFQCFNYRGVMRPNRTYEGRGPKYFGGISDHLPLECILTMEADD